MADSIAELVVALDERRKPRLAWVVRWSASGGDPVAAAWARSQSPAALVRLLEIARHPACARVRAVLRAPFVWEGTDYDRARCDAIRRIVPTPPTLTELLTSSAPGVLGLAARPAAEAAGNQRGSLACARLFR